MTEKSRVFYQHPYVSHPLTFSGQLPSIPVPNMKLRIIIAYYGKFSSFHFELILRNNIHLSIVRENGRSQVQIAQIIGDKMTMTPCFEHDGYGEAVIYFSELGEFILGLVTNSSPNIVFTAQDWVWGE